MLLYTIELKLGGKHLDNFSIRLSLFERLFKITNKYEAVEERRKSEKNHLISIIFRRERQKARMMKIKLDMASLHEATKEEQIILNIDIFNKRYCLKYFSGVELLLFYFSMELLFNRN